ncbi:MAG: DUF4124 domain-containing protein [Motiliproteus sp.]
MPPPICCPTLQTLYRCLDITVIYRLFFAVLLMLLPALAVGQLYRCQAPDGHLSFQDRPCVGAGEPLHLPLYPPSATEVARVERRRQQLRDHMAGVYQRRAQLLEAAQERRAEERRLAESQRQLADGARATDNDHNRVWVRYRRLGRGGHHTRPLFRSGCTVVTLGCNIYTAARSSGNRPLPHHHRPILRLRIR